MLDRIIAHKKRILEGIDTSSEIRKIEKLTGELPDTIGFGKSLKADIDISIIAEIKRRSPSRGILNAKFELVDLVQAYEKAGAKAISVLTENKFFAGSAMDLCMARKNTALPILRKDFIVHEYQVWESRAIGADAILLIVKALSVAELSRLSQLAFALGLDVVVEIHDLTELEIALSMSPDIIGVNNRNLATFETKLTSFEQLAMKIPSGILIISESGVHCRNDILYLKKYGADAVLVGESIIISADPYQKIRELMGIAP